jgi:hypothetical protein
VGVGERTAARMLPAALRLGRAARPGALGLRAERPMFSPGKMPGDKHFGPIKGGCYRRKPLRLLWRVHAKLAAK